MFGKILMRYKLEDTCMLRCISRWWHVSSVFFLLFFNFLIKRLIDKKEKAFIKNNKPKGKWGQIKFFRVLEEMQISRQKHFSALLSHLRFPFLVLPTIPQSHCSPFSPTRTELFPS